MIGLRAVAERVVLRGLSAERNESMCTFEYFEHANTQRMCIVFLGCTIDLRLDRS